MTVNETVVVVVESQPTTVVVAGGGGVSAIQAGPGIDVSQQTGVVTLSTASGLQYNEVDLSDQSGVLQLNLGGYLETVFDLSLFADTTVLPPTNAFVGARFIVDVTYNTHTYTHPGASGLTTKWVDGPNPPAASATRDVWFYWIRATQFAVINGQGATIPALMLAWDLQGFV